MAQIYGNLPCFGDLDRPVVVLTSPDWPVTGGTSCRLTGFDRLRTAEVETGLGDGPDQQ